MLMRKISTAVYDAAVQDVVVTEYQTGEAI